MICLCVLCNKYVRVVHRYVRAVQRYAWYASLTGALASIAITPLQTVRAPYGVSPSKRRPPHSRIGACD